MEKETETERDTKGGPDAEAEFERRRQAALETLDRICTPFPPVGDANAGKTG